MSIEYLLEDILGARNVRATAKLRHVLWAVQSLFTFDNVACHVRGDILFPWWKESGFDHGALLPFYNPGLIDPFVGFAHLDQHTHEFFKAVTSGQGVSGWVLATPPLPGVHKYVRDRAGMGGAGADRSAPTEPKLVYAMRENVQMAYCIPVPSENAKALLIFNCRHANSLFPNVRIDNLLRIVDRLCDDIREQGDEKGGESLPPGPDPTGTPQGNGWQVSDAFYRAVVAGAMSILRPAPRSRVSAGDIKCRFYAAQAGGNNSDDRFSLTKRNRFFRDDVNSDLVLKLVFSSDHHQQVKINGGNDQRLTLRRPCKDLREVLSKLVIGDDREPKAWKHPITDGSHRCGAVLLALDLCTPIFFPDFRRRASEAAPIHQLVFDPVEKGCHCSLIVPLVRSTHQDCSAIGCLAVEATQGNLIRPRQASTLAYWLAKIANDLPSFEPAAGRQSGQENSVCNQDLAPT